MRAVGEVRAGMAGEVGRNGRLNALGVGGRSESALSQTPPQRRLTPCSIAASRTARAIS
jgi:hypothetical protein